LQVGLSTYSFPWAIGLRHFGAPTEAATTLLQIAHRHAINHVQFGDNLPLHLLGHEHLKKLQEAADSLGIQIEVGARGLREDHLLKYLFIANFFKSPFLRIVIDDEGYEPEVPEVINIIKKVMPQFREAGVVLAIENHDRFPAERLKSVIEQTHPQWVGICLDTANSLGANEGTAEVVRVLAPYTVNLHVKDIRIHRVRSKMGFNVEGCAAGTGMLDIPKIIGELKPFGRCRTATLELWSNAAETPQQTIAQEEAWVEQSIDYLKNILT
jgi:sugar phosphate isomerase/epimerase